MSSWMKGKSDNEKENYVKNISAAGEDCCTCSFKKASVSNFTVSNQLLTSLHLTKLSSPQWNSVY